MEFDSEMLAHYAGKRAERDDRLRRLGATDVEAFKAHLKDREIGNETDTDEYRETQPYKGLSYIATFMADFGPGQAACEEMRELTITWLNTGANLTEAYSGANELAAILAICFDFAWATGEIGLYEPYPDELLTEEIAESRIG